MPRVRQLTPELRREDERRRQITRNCVIVSNAARQSEYGSVKAVADEMGVAYSTLRQALKTGSIRAVDMASVIRILKLDDDTVRALMGNPKRCRFERGGAA